MLLFLQDISTFAIIFLSQILEDKSVRNVTYHEQKETDYTLQVCAEERSRDIIEEDMPALYVVAEKIEVVA